MSVMLKFSILNKFNSKRLLNKGAYDVWLRCENSSKIVNFPDFHQIFVKQLQKDVLRSFRVPKPSVQSESILAGDPKPVRSCDVGRYAVPKKWEQNSIIIKKI